MRFRVTQNVACPFSPHVFINKNEKHTLEGTIVIKSKYPENVKAETLHIYIPAPPGTAECRC